MSNFNLENYKEVKDRIPEFYARYPEGSIKTFLRHFEDGEIIFEARIYRTPEEVEKDVYTSGWSHEIIGANFINKTSALEVSETSAVGRALANLDFAADANRPSREEMHSVIQQREEHKRMQEYVTRVGQSLAEDTLIDFGNGDELAVKYLRANWTTMERDFKFLRNVVRILQEATGIQYVVPEAS